MGAAPLFVERGDGAQVWDVDGNQYVDFVLGLLPVVLGYRDPEVDNAIRTQLDKGITLSLATELEAELAERLVRLIPCAELSRRHTLFRSSRSRPTTSDTPICGLTLAASSAHIGGHEE
jgi:glutamate-1-semialdehyde aminotransferase